MSKMISKMNMVKKKIKILEMNLKKLFWMMKLIINWMLLVYLKVNSTRITKKHKKLKN